MEQVIVGIIAIVAGCAIIIFRDKFIRDSMIFQTKLFGFRYNDKDIKAGHVAAWLIGAGFVVIGLLRLVSEFG